MSWITTYTRGISGIAAGGEATELSYRTDIENMLNAVVAELDIEVKVLQEPSRQKTNSAPDFRISGKGGGIVGYVECKTPGENLNKLITGAQLKKYTALSSNILLTDSWQWILLRDGKKSVVAVLTENPDKKAREAFTELLRIFLDAEAEKIGDAERLATALARRCALLREGLESHSADDENSDLHGLLSAFKTVLDTELEFEKFADAFAQTLVYSLLMAKLKAPTSTKLDLYDINRHIPANFALIREIALFAQRLSNRGYRDLAWVVEDILAIINAMDAAGISESMSYNHGNTGMSDEDDPYIYFYENFLAAYDATMRERRGVYYTPPPVVKFIVRAVDDLLKRDFGLADGLATTDTVTALDFAAGTGTFMLEMIRIVFDGASPARRDILAHDHICEHFYGFELLIAPYVISHLKLSQFLADNGTPLNEDERINVFLTNTLEKLSKQVTLKFMPQLAEEANSAQKIKDEPVLVITGNPPYSVVSQNKGHWINGLIDDYRVVDGKPLNEKKLVLTDDYVKFIRFAQWKMENVERGMVAIITNHGFLDNPTFRGMRQSLMGTFDALYFLDLHGNANRKETAPDGGKDENVFDIRQGVAISLLIKNKELKDKGVFRSDIYGKRNEKYAACLSADINNVQWQKIEPTSPMYLFAPRDNLAAKNYEKFPSIKNIFSLSGGGVITRRDSVAISFDQKTVKNTVRDFQTMKKPALRKKYDIPTDSPNWKIANVCEDLIKHKGVVQSILYRPFDIRYTYYTGKSSGFHSRPSKEIMQNLLANDNIGIVTVRQVAEEDFNHAIATDNVTDSRITLSNKGACYIFPLYRYDAQINGNGNGQEVVRNENFTPQFRKWIDEKYKTTHPPKTILGCIYAILHSPTYREKYVDFLRTDFPRIPFPDDNAEFKRLANIGNQLMQAHLLNKYCTGTLAKHCGSGTSHKVERIKYDDKNGRLYFNKDEYFAPLPPEVFNFPIGGYLPLDKYLKSRKGYKLNLADTDTIKKTANAIAFTIKKMQEIDEPV